MSSRQTISIDDAALYFQFFGLELSEITKEPFDAMICFDNMSEFTKVLCEWERHHFIDACIFMELADSQIEESILSNIMTKYLEFCQKYIEASVPEESKDYFYARFVGRLEAYRIAYEMCDAAGKTNAPANLRKLLSEILKKLSEADLEDVDNFIINIVSEEKVLLPFQRPDPASIGFCSIVYVHISDYLEKFQSEYIILDDPKKLEVDLSGRL